MKHLPSPCPASEPATPRARTLRRVVLGGLLAVSLLSARTTVRSEPAAGPTEETLASYPWPDAIKATLAEPRLAGYVHLGDPSPEEARAGIKGKVLTVSNHSVQALRLTLLTVPTPLITRNFYALSGQVSYTDVRGSAFLEMWSVFPPEKAGGEERPFFSRTLGETGSGPMETLHDTSGWRPVLLPFNAAGAGAHPARLVVNLVLPGEGTVRLGPLRLAQYNYGAAIGTATAPVSAPAWRWPAVGGGVTLLVVAGAVVAWRASRRQRATEWRRMAAHDVSAG